MRIESIKISHCTKCIFSNVLRIVRNRKASKSITCKMYSLVRPEDHKEMTALLKSITCKIQREVTRFGSLSLFASWGVQLLDIEIFGWYGRRLLRRFGRWSELGANYGSAGMPICRNISRIPTDRHVVLESSQPVLIITAHLAVLGKQEKAEPRNLDYSTVGPAATQGGRWLTAHWLTTCEQPNVDISAFFFRTILKSRFLMLFLSRLIARFSKHDFWNPEEILDRYNNIPRNRLNSLTLCRPPQ